MTKPKEDELGPIAEDELGPLTDAAAQRTVDRIPQSTHEWAVEGLKDAANVAPAGATFDRDDEISGALAVVGQAIKDPVGFSRASAGKAYDAAQQSRQASKDESDQRSPTAAIGGRVTGGVAASAALGGVGGAVGRSLPAVGRAIQTVGGVGKSAEGASLGARGAQWAANAAVPGAIQGSDSDSAAEGAAFGLGGATLAALPGAVVRGVGNAAPAVAKWARQGEANTWMQSTGHGDGLMKRIAKDPGGQEAYMERMQGRGIGNRFWPTPTKAASEAEDALGGINQQQDDIANKATDVRIDAAGNAAAIRAQKAQMAVGAEDLRARNEEIAAAQERAGREVFETETGFTRTPAPGARTVERPADPLVTPAPSQMDPQAPGPRNVQVIQGRLAPEPLSAGRLALPPPQESAIARYSHVSPEDPALPPGTETALGPVGPGTGLARREAPAHLAKAPDQYGTVRATTSKGRQLTLAQQQREISDYNARAKTATGLSDTRTAGVYTDAARTMNDRAEEALNKVDPELGGQWRQNKRDQADLIRLEESATAQAGAPGKMGGFMRAGRVAGATAAGAAAPGVGIAAAAGGEAATLPQPRMHAYRGVNAVAKAIANKAGPTTALGRFLARSPGGVSTPLGAGAGRGLQAVQEAANRGPDALATEHYLQNETNSEYNKAVNRPDE